MEHDIFPAEGKELSNHAMKFLSLYSDRVTMVKVSVRCGIVQLLFYWLKQVTWPGLTSQGGDTPLLERH